MVMFPHDREGYFLTGMLFSCCTHVSLDKRVFGVPLFVNVRNTGQALPPVISHAMDYLRADNRMELLGLFRRAASKARVDLLKEVAESDPGKYGSFPPSS